MKTPALERTSAAKAGWLIIVLTIGWLVFLLLPDPPKKEAAPSAPVQVPASSLTRAGLRENPDWDGLPEYFAVWAGDLKWDKDRTKFAYWNPATKSYSYFFEAERKDGKYRFRSISRRAMNEDEARFFADEDREEVSNEVPELKSESPTHPFVFEFDGFPIGRAPHKEGLAMPGKPVPSGSATKVTIDVEAKLVELPPPTVQKP